MDIKGNRAWEGVRAVARREMAVRLHQHFKRKGDMQQTEPASRVPRVETDELARAFFEQRARGHIPGAAGGVVTDFLSRVFETQTAQREEVSRYDAILEPRHRFGSHAFGDDGSQFFLASVPIVPELSEDGRGNWFQ